MSRRGPVARALALLALAAAGASAQKPAPTRVWLNPVTSMFEHLDAGFFGPVGGVYYDRRRDEIWVADRQSNLLAVFDRDGLPLHTAVPGEPIQAPSRLVVDRDGNVLLLDQDRSRVALLDWRGRYVGPLELAGLPAEPVITALALDDEDNLYVGESSAGEVLVYGPDRRLRFRFGSLGEGPGQFESIAGIAADGRRIVVTDAIATPVQVFDRRGGFLRGFGGHAIGVANFSLPAGVALDGRGRIVVIDSIRQEIKVFEESGKFLDRFGGGGFEPGSVYYPESVVFDGRDRLYVAERANRRVQVFEVLEIPVQARERRSTRRSWRP
jgi:DNA-binding beta-propeller fold protein YncE